MRPVIKPIIRKTKTCKNVNHTIFLQYCYNSKKRVVISTGISIPGTYWDKSTCLILSTLPMEYGSATVLQAAIDKQHAKAERIVIYAVKKNYACPMNFLKRNFRLPDCWDLDQLEDGKDYLSVFYQIDRYIDEKASVVRPATITIIKGMKKHLLGFQDYIGYNITFESFNAVLYEQLFRYLTFEIPVLRKAKATKGLRLNTVGKTIKQLKSFIKDRMQKKVISYLDLGYFKCIEEEVDGVFLNLAELSKIYRLDLSHQPQLIKYRDMFIVGCLTGFRFSDLSNLSPGHLKADMLHVRQKKTNLPVVVPLRSEAREILVETYHMRMPKISMANFNHYIKEVVKLASIDEPSKSFTKGAINLCRKLDRSTDG